MFQRIDKTLLLFLGAVIGVGLLVFQSRTLTQSSYEQTPIDPLSMTGEFDPHDTDAMFYGQPFLARELPTSEKALALAEPETPTVLGVNSEEKRIEVDLTNQRVYAFEGERKVMDFLVSTGKWGRTPTGEFRIWGKFKYTKMSGGNRALGTYYYLPNVPFVQFFSNNEVAASRGFSLHGTYWHENFGTPMSHGCVNMKTEEAELLYYWSSPTPGDTNSIRATKEDPGTQVIIYGVAPQG